MRLGVVSGPRYYLIGGQYYTFTSFHSETWKECLAVFDEVIIVDRAVYPQKVDEGYKPVLIDGVRFIEYPNFTGFLSLLKAVVKMFLIARWASRQADMWHLSAPNFGSICMWFWLWFYGIPYSLEMRGEQGMNPDYLKVRGLRFHQLYAWIMRIGLRLQLSRPLAVVAVSLYLINKYRSRNGCPTYVVSNNRIPAEVYRQPRRWKDSRGIRTVVSVGSLESVKNPLGLLRACAFLDRRMSNWKLVWLGTGPLLEKMQSLAAELGIAQKVECCGFVPWGPALFEKLSRADVFVLNSLSEGMPKAMLEAMAAGLPVIGTNVGGISEVLDEEDMVAPFRDDLLADKLYEVLSDPVRLTEMSWRSVEKAKNSSAEILSAKKIAFYRDVHGFAEEILQKA